MINFKLNRKIEMKESFSKVVSEIFVYNWDDSMLELDRLEDNLIQHLISRGNGVDAVREKVRLIRLYLQEPREAEDKKRLVLHKINELLMTISLPKNGQPLDSLRMIYDELRDDWAGFWSKPTEGTVSSITEDLDLMNTLELRFRNEPPDIYKQFREILVARGKCYTVLPLMSVIARGHTLGEQHRSNLFEVFSSLFIQTERLMAPHGFVFKTDEEDNGKDEPVITVKRPRGKLKGMVS